MQRLLIGSNGLGAACRALQSAIHLGAPQLDDVAVNYQLILHRCATKKAGGQAVSQGKTVKPKHRGFKKWAGAIVFPGAQILYRQTLPQQWFPGYNTQLSKDWSIMAVAVGYVKFTREKVEVNGELTERKYIHVVPVTDDWSDEYKKLQPDLIEKRAKAKRAILNKPVVEPALFMPLSLGQGKPPVEVFDVGNPPVTSKRGLRRVAEQQQLLQAR